MHAISLFLTLLWTLLLHRMRERSTRLGLILLPVFAIGGVGFYKIILNDTVQILPELTAPAWRTVVVAGPDPLPGLDIPAAEAAARLSLHPWFKVELAPDDPGTGALVEQEVDVVVVAGPDGRLLVRTRLAEIQAGDLARDLLMLAPAIQAGNPAPPPGAPFDVRVEEVAVTAGSALVRLVPFWFVMMLAASCGGTGAAGFVADVRKGTMRSFLLAPVPMGWVLSANALAVALLALVQTVVVTFALILYGEVPTLSPGMLALAAAATVAMVTAVGFASQSVRPAETEKGSGVMMTITITLSMIAYNGTLVLEPEAGRIIWWMVLNPFGAAMDLFTAGLRGGGTLNPVWLNLTVLGSVTLVAGTAAWLRFTHALEPDWSRR